ncbi:3TM-type holin [Microvirga sp. TS319]|uniref:3TM-type holin n=1 Tax=Microvirga sp. TS319 TaxID=3241165 RepID=UPI00351A7431
MAAGAAIGAIVSEVIAPVILDALKTDTTGTSPDEIKTTAEERTRQIAINLADAQSETWFQKGWRPFVGWVCGFGLLASWAGVPFGLHMIPPDQLYPLLYGLLGLGGYRSAERVIPAVVGRMKVRS